MSSKYFFFSKRAPIVETYVIAKSYLSVFVAHRDNESINTLIEVSERDLIDEFFSLNSCFVVCAEEGLDDGDDLQVHEIGVRFAIGKFYK